MTLDEAQIAFPVGTRVYWVEDGWYANALVTEIAEIYEGEPHLTVSRTHSPKPFKIRACNAMIEASDVLELRRQILRLRDELDQAKWPRIPVLPEHWDLRQGTDLAWEAHSADGVIVEEAQDISLLPSDGRFRVMVDYMAPSVPGAFNVDAQGRPLVPSRVFIALAIANGHELVYMKDPA